jgi:hypothetical protein
MSNLEFGIEKSIDGDGDLKIKISERDFDNIFDVAAVEFDFISIILLKLENEISEKIEYEDGDGQCGLMLRCRDKKQFCETLKKINFANFQIVPELE